MFTLIIFLILLLKVCKEIKIWCIHWNYSVPYSLSKQCKFTSLWHQQMLTLQNKKVWWIKVIFKNVIFPAAYKYQVLFNWFPIKRTNTRNCSILHFHSFSNLLSQWNKECLELRLIWLIVSCIGILFTKL